LGRINKSYVENLIGGAEGAYEPILCTDAWSSYKIFAEEKGIQHYRINSKAGYYTLKESNGAVQLTKRIVEEE
jgi:hypothetical protein